MRTFLLLLGLSFASINIGQINPEIQKIVDKSVDKKLFHGTNLSILKDGQLTTYSAGNIEDDSQYYLASITKMYTTVVLINLDLEGKLSLDDKLSQHLSETTMQGLHVYKGIDYSEDLTIRHLLNQTSGLPDYYEDKSSSGQSFFKKLLVEDQYITLNDVLKMSKSQEAHFRPGADKAYYSDTNFQLLQVIIEQVTQKSIRVLFHEYIFEPLGLKKTYSFSDIDDDKPASCYYKKDKFHIPKAMTSFAADGGMVSTSRESIQFLKAFYTGELFPEAYLKTMQDWKQLDGPIQYGSGMMRIQLPAFMTGGLSIDLVGHSGSTGSFSYYDKKRDIYIAGTVNQIHKKTTPIKLMIKVISEINK